MYQPLFHSLLKLLSGGQTLTKKGEVFQLTLYFPEDCTFLGIYLPEIESQLGKVTKIIGLDPDFTDFVVDPELHIAHFYVTMNGMPAIQGDGAPTTARDILSSCLEQLRKGEYELEKYEIRQLKDPSFLFEQSFVAGQPTKETNIENTIRINGFRLERLVESITEAFSSIDYFSAMGQNTSQGFFGGPENYVKYLESESKNFVSLQHDQLLKISRNVSELGLLPFALTVRNLAKVIETIAEKQGKKIDFIQLNSNAYLSGSLSEIIYPVLLHLVRNCVDHGIELPEKRKSKNKSESGKIILQAFNTEDGSFIIQLLDDGKGIDVKQIAAKAVDLEIVTPAEVDKLTDIEIIDFIFHTGFTTAEQVTTVSGRGLGMDIVKKTLVREKGSIRIQSRVDQGCHFLIKIPNFPPIMQCEVVQIGAELYGIPTTEIVSCETKKVPDCTEAVGILNDNDIYINMTRAIFPDAPVVSDNEKRVLVVNSFWGPFTLITDKSLGDFMVALKDPGNLFLDLETIAGTATLPDGSLISIIYLDTFLKRIWNRVKPAELFQKHPHLLDKFRLHKVTI